MNPSTKLSAPIHRLKHRAKLLARDGGIPLNQALDRIAAGEGFTSWSLLAARAAAAGPPESSSAARMFARLRPGDLVLLGARPGHGKTLLGLELLLEAVKAGAHGAFYTLEYTHADVAARLAALGADPGRLGDALAIVTSDAISADYIVADQQAASRGTLIVIDYLQILDQDRAKPALATQIAALKALAQERGLILVFIAQIDRRYDPAARPVPDITDLRLPNPIDLSLFSKAYFLNGGDVRFTMLG